MYARHCDNALGIVSFAHFFCPLPSLNVGFSFLYPINISESRSEKAHIIRKQEEGPGHTSYPELIITQTQEWGRKERAQASPDKSRDWCVFVAFFHQSRVHVITSMSQQVGILSNAHFIQLISRYTLLC